jgi:hypothetical protein
VQALFFRALGPTILMQAQETSASGQYRTLTVLLRMSAMGQKLTFALASIEVVNAPKEHSKEAF